MQWYYAKEGKQYGPVDDTEFRRLAREGRILPDDLVWNQAQGEEWKPASSFSFLFLPPVDLQPPELPAEPESKEIVYQPGTLPNRDLMRRARESLKGHWAEGVLATLLYMVIIALPSFVAGLVSPHPVPHQTSFHPEPTSLSLAGNLLQLVCFLISPPLIVGLSYFFLGLARRSNVQISQLFWGFGILWKAIASYLLVALFTLLWLFLALAPAIAAFVLAPLHHDQYHAMAIGIILLGLLGFTGAMVKVLGYYLWLWVLADDVTIGPLLAIRRSQHLMRGKKWKFICLVLRFFGWWFLALLTCGIGFLWLIPYMQTSLAHFYLDAKGESVKPIPAN